MSTTINNITIHNNHFYERVEIVFVEEPYVAPVEPVAQVEPEVEPEEEVRTCSKCRRGRPLDDFLGKNSRVFKKCERCRAANLAAKKKGYCDHGTLKRICKTCTDPITVAVTNMLGSSRQSDRKYGRYDPVDFVDRPYLEALLRSSPNCWYPECNRPLQHDAYGPDLATIERLNNDVGHIRSNVVICCLHCNQMRKSNANTPSRRRSASSSASSARFSASSETSSE